MCLRYKDAIPAKKRICYKIVKNTKEKGVYTARYSFGSETVYFKLGEEQTDLRTTEIQMGSEKYYPAGFHSYKRKADAIAVAKGIKIVFFSARFEDIAVLRVAVKDIVASGTQLVDGRLREVVVSRIIKPLNEVEI